MRSLYGVLAVGALILATPAAETVQRIIEGVLIQIQIVLVPNGVSLQGLIRSEVCVTLSMLTDERRR